MIDDYIEFKEKTLKRDGKFNKVIAALRGITVENSLEEKMIFIDKWVIEHPENTNLKDYWMGIKEISDEDKIAELYKSIWDKINVLGRNVPDLI